MRDGVLTFTKRGIYCAAGDFYIDPWRPVDRAVITHAHSDHARPGHGHYLATTGTAPVMRHRLGDIAVDTMGFGQTRQIGDARVSFHPAGHLVGSAQVRVEVGGEVWVVSGDYKTVVDRISEPFEPVRAHAFITECTFGLPVFNWADEAHLAAEINAWWAAAAAEGRPAMLGAYALGKAQRILSLLDPSIGPILTHGAIENTNEVLRGQGVALPGTIRVTPDTKAKDHPGAIVLATPSALGSTWAGRFKGASKAFASGWMAVRGIRRRRAADKGFVISDHADWAGLNEAIKATGAERVFVTHGYTSPFRRWLESLGYDAAVVETEYEGEILETPDEPKNPKETESTDATHP